MSFPVRISLSRTVSVGEKSFLLQEEKKQEQMSYSAKARAKRRGQRLEWSRGWEMKNATVMLKEERKRRES